MRLPTDFLSRVLELPYGKMVYELSRQVHSWTDGCFVLETEDYDFDLEAFAAVGGCSLRMNTSVFGHSDTKWYDGRIITNPLNALLDIEWRGNKFCVFRLTHDNGKRSFIVTNEALLAEQFFEAVCRWNTDVRDSIVVANCGGFERDDELKRQIQGTRLEDLTLSEEVRATLTQNFDEFFASKDLYSKYKIPWKRGVILYGPPGNGKTMVLKAMVNRLRVACIYVRTLEMSHWSEQNSIAMVFARAREMAPCMVVMEDLDSMITSENLSYLLNELDGFRPLEGVLTVATTNHLDRIDTALTERPSRFDRKIRFALPDQPERTSLISSFTAEWEEPLRLTPDQAIEIGAATEGFSMASLKELCISSLGAWMRDQVPGSMAEKMVQVIEILRQEMVKRESL